MPGANEQNLPIYVLRVGEEAFEHINEARERFDELEGVEIALEWQDGFFDFFATLAGLPHPYPLAPESDLFRVPVYRRAPHSAPYRLLYTIVEADIAEDMGESPFILLLAVRHAAARAITPSEARRIQARTSLMPPNGS